VKGRTGDKASSTASFVKLLKVNGSVW